jgi:hypothetical protein
MPDLSNSAKKHTSKSRETFPLTNYFDTFAVILEIKHSSVSTDRKVMRNKEKSLL